MKTKLAVVLLTSLVATSAYAGVKEKKAMRAADAAIATEVTKAQSACGNSQLEVKVAWDEFKNVIKANKEKLDSKGYKPAELIADTGYRTASVLEALAKICNADADYKEEIATLTSVTINPKPDTTDYRSSFALNDKNLVVTSGYYMSRSAGDYISPIKNLF